MSDRNRFDRFTEQARRVMSLAQEEARGLQHNYVGTEHLLLGLLGEDEGIAAKVLKKLGVEADAVRNKIESIVGRGKCPVSGEVGFTGRAKKTIELAVKEARRLQHVSIGTEHLLLGLLHEGQGLAVSVLEGLKVDPKEVQRQVQLLMY